MRVASLYGLTRPVPFLDVDVAQDNAVYLDPSAIRNGRDAASGRAHNLMVDFFTEVLRLRRSTSGADQADGLSLLQNLHEPNQTRLGVSARGVGGKAFGPGLADELWDELAHNPAARYAALTRLEHLPIFLNRVGPDLISDLTTRVIFEVLVDFTHDMMSRYPALARATSTEAIPIYDTAVRKWGLVDVELPFVAPHQLLLVPKEWVYWRSLMAPEPFYNRFATSTVQIERGHFDPDGRFRGPSKKSLNDEFRDHRKLNNDQAVKYKLNQERDLVLEYQAEVDREFEPLTDEEVDRRTG